jgi:signal transduction histidine kinase/DNA-binding response OmpR family regulator
VLIVDPAFRPQIQVARAAQIWRRSRWAIFLYVLILIPLGFGTSLANDQPYLFAGTVFFFALTGALRWRSLLMGLPPSDPEQADLWLRSYRRHTAIAGLIWGLFACYMEIQYRGAFLQFTVLLVSAGICCFAMGAFAGDLKLTITYLACSMIPTLAGVASGNSGEAAVLVGLVLIFLASVIFQVFEIDDWFVRSTVESLLLEKSRQEAEAAARVKSEFLANMSHELRTPMNGVMGTLELILQSGLDRDQKLLVRTSHRSAEALLDILNDILDFSKMSAGKLDFARHDFILRNAIEDVFDLLGPRAFEKGIDLGYHIDPAVPEWVSGDEGRLRQVLMNLVSNAIKFSRGGEWPNGGGVFVDTQLASQTDQSVRIQFTVADRGLGMAPATVARLFQPFMQADGSTSRRHGGTGLGLAISRQLVAAMGGSISAESEENAGAKFTFDIELRRPSNPHTLTLGTSCGCKVLVIEPAPLSRATIGDLVSRHGADCTLVATVTEARQYLEPGNFQFIVAGTAAGQSPSTVRSELHAALSSNPAPAVFLMHHRGEPADDVVALTRPVRATQVAETMIAAQCLPRSIAPAPVRPPARLSGHVLIAEDNPVNQMLAQRLVVALGLTAKVVPDGQAAMDAAATQEFRLVLMDCQMPGVDGYEATRRLRQDPATAELPIVAMTANAMKGDRELCLAAGMNDYVSKPIRLDRLREVLSHYLPAASPDQKV